MLLSALVNQIVGIEWLEVVGLGIAGALVFKLASYNSTGRHNKKSPISFSLIYWLKDRDNWNDLLLSSLVYLLIVIFKDQMIQWFPESPATIWVSPYINHYVFYLVVGFSLTYITKKIRTLIQKKNKED